MGATNTKPFLVLFGLVFIAAGAGLGVASVRILLEARALLSWREVPAQVLACDLRIVRDSEGSTYRTGAHYRYAVDGVAYEGTRVSLHGGSDNIGDYQERLYDRLEACRRAGRSVVCRANPAHPAEAILDPRPRPELIALDLLALLVFGGMGVGVACFAFAKVWARPLDLVRTRQIPMRGTMVRRVVSMTALAWNAYAAWVLESLWVTLRPAGLPWYLWLFASLGGLLALAALVMQVRFRQFGRSVFEGVSQPAAGGPLDGAIRIPARVAAAGGFALRLKCLRQRTTESGGERATVTECCWEDRRTGVVGLEAGAETLVPVRFVLPADAPGSTAEDDGADRVFWLLNARASAWPFGYRASFEVPVAPPRLGAVRAAAPEAERRAPTLDQQAASLRLRYMRLEAGGFELARPAFHAKGSIAVLTAALAVWSAFCYMLWHVVDASRAVAGIFTLLECFIAWSWLVAVSVAKGLRVDRARRECLLWRRIFGVTMWSRRVPFGQVKAIRGEKSAQLGNGSHCRLVLEPCGGVSLTVLDDLTDWGGAQQLAASLSVVVATDRQSKERA